MCWKIAFELSWVILVILIYIFQTPWPWNYNNLISILYVWLHDTKKLYIYVYSNVCNFSLLQSDEVCHCRLDITLGQMRTSLLNVVWNIRKIFAFMKYVWLQIGVISIMPYSVWYQLFVLYQCKYIPTSDSCMLTQCADKIIINLILSNQVTVVFGFNI